MKAESVLRQLQEGVTLLISNLFDCFDPFFEHSFFFVSVSICLDLFIFCSKVKFYSRTQGAEFRGEATGDIR